MIQNRIAYQGRYTLNEHYFDIIDNERKAYFLGFLFADGCNDSNRTIKIHLSECDRELLIKLNKEIGSNAPISKSPPRVIKFKKNLKSYVQQPSYIFRINSVYLCKKLSELGCIPRKTFSLTFPDDSKLPIKFQKDFLRGYFDGDGSLSVPKNKGVNFTFIGRKQFCLKVKNILELNLHLILTFRKYKKHSFWTIQTGSIPKIKKILDFLYNNATIYLNRKHKKYIDFIKLKYEPYIKYNYKWNHGNKYSKPQY